MTRRGEPATSLAQFTLVQIFLTLLFVANLYYMFLYFLYFPSVRFFTISHDLLAGLAQASLQWRARPPSHACEPRDVEELARRAVGLRGVEPDAAGATAELGDEDVRSGPDVDAGEPGRGVRRGGFAEEFRDEETVVVEAVDGVEDVRTRRVEVVAGAVEVGRIAERRRSRLSPGSIPAMVRDGTGGKPPA